MTESCCTPERNIMLLTCAGASNVGQLANQAAIELTQDRLAKYSCLAGIGACLSGSIQSAKDAPVMLLIDGCPTACGKGTLGHAGIALKNHIVITELGIMRNEDFHLKAEDLFRVKAAIREEILRLISGTS